METKHTPGPWAWQRFGDTYSLTAQHGRREQIISAIPHGQMKYPVVAMASDGRLQDIDPEHPNARLIAAAPELLEALETIVRQMKAYTPMRSGSENELDIAMQVIKKAKGE